MRNEGSVRNGSSFWARSDKKGRFLFAPLAQGDYTLRIDPEQDYYRVVRQLRVTRTNYDHCRNKIEIQIGFDVCDTGTNVNGVDKERDLLEQLGQPNK
ncbi:MAG TPA: hypothetical protein VMB66_16205 [Candidatus Acidoferrales bacterium]|nr:hypothetical protein [Candidatus Acidoferrales bacterium]